MKQLFFDLQRGKPRSSGRGQERIIWCFISCALLLSQDGKCEHQGESAEQEGPVKDCQDEVFIEGGGGFWSTKNEVNCDSKEENVEGDEKVFDVGKGGDFECFSQGGVICYCDKYKSDENGDCCKQGVKKRVSWNEEDKKGDKNTEGQDQDVRKKGAKKISFKSDSKDVGEQRIYSCCGKKVIGGFVSKGKIAVNNIPANRVNRGIKTWFF